MTNSSAIDWTAQPLGKITDAALAKRLSVTTAVVTHTRRKLGIPGLRVVNDAKRLAGPGAGKIDWSVQPLGKMSDRDLAKILGTHRARVRLARVYRGIPLYVEQDTALDRGPVGGELERSREGRWYRYPVTADECRYCTEARHKRQLRGRSDFMVRWTDQGPACARHYVALPQCSRCEAPAANEGDLCEECTTRAIRTEREEAGWRREIHLSVPALERGDVETVRRGIRAFERKREKHLPGGTQ
jgi:hypothetical protein